MFDPHKLDIRWDCASTLRHAGGVSCHVPSLSTYLWHLRVHACCRLKEVILCHSDEFKQVISTLKGHDDKVSELPSYISCLVRQRRPEITHAQVGVKQKQANPWVWGSPSAPAAWLACVRSLKGDCWHGLVAHALWHAGRRAQQLSELFCKAGMCCCGCLRDWH